MAETKELNFEEVESSHLKAVAYDSEDGVLYVVFKPKKDGVSAVYHYKSVSQTAYETLLFSKSPGSTLRDIQNVSPHCKVGEVDAEGNITIY